jgi:hypothetical protein
MEICKMNIEISDGELLDKISILEIKLKKIKDDKKRFWVNQEIGILIPKIVNNLKRIYPKSKIYKSLFNINKQIWNVEDKIRKKEDKKEFDNQFIQLARKVYYLNDKRYVIKNKINILTSSNIREIKEYKEYGNGGY